MFLFEEFKEALNLKEESNKKDEGYDYKGYRIINTNGIWHVFFGKNGTDRIDFSTDKEAEEYIDSLNN